MQMGNALATDRWPWWHYNKITAQWHHNFY